MLNGGEGGGIKGDGKGEGGGGGGNGGCTQDWPFSTNQT